MSTALRGAAVGSEWLREGKRVVSALLVEVAGSAPLDPGATMLIAESGEIEGSITGGCVEGAILAEARQVFAGGPPRIASYGFTDELAGTVGLTCGGIVEVLIYELAGAAGEVERVALEAAGQGQPVAIATLVEGERVGAKLAVLGGETIGSLGGAERLDRAVARDAAGMLEAGLTGVRRYGVDGATLGAEIAVQIRSFAPPPQMLIFGAIDFSVALAKLAAEVGYRVSVSDPREPFIASPRFAEAAEVIVAWPQDALAGRSFGPRDAILVFTHDPKFDVPAVQGALESGAGYVGALGSRKTSDDRNRRLREAGLAEQDLRRLHAPCGLDIGGATPEEVAVSILAEIIAVRAGRVGRPLREGSAPIHPRHEP
jgi:xanthine dehydrogenase accessory factor